MKDYHKILYIFSGILLLIVILGGSLTKPIFRNIAENNLEHTVIRKSSIDSLDNRIDDVLYKISGIQMQIDKIKNIFSTGEIDENKYQKEKHGVFERNIYNPLLEVLIFMYRGVLFFIAILLFMSAVMFHMTYNSRDMKLRVKKLEERLSQLTI